MITSIGEILVDIFKSDDSITVFPGGAPFNVVSNISYWKGNILFYGAIGNDNYGRLIKEYIIRNNINSIIDVLDDKYTTQAIVTLTSGERSFKFVRDNGADYILSIEQIKKLNIKPNDIFHIGSLMLSYENGQKFFFNAIKYLKSKGAKISFDVNYREDIFSSPEEAKNIFIKAIKCSDIIKFTEEELILLTNNKNIKESLSILLNDKQIAVITLGKEGSIFYSKDKYIKVPSKPIKPIDTTGAGDAFYSYFLYSLDNGLDITDNNQIINELTIANAMGAIATQKKGAISVVPSIKEAIEYIKTY